MFMAFSMDKPDMDAKDSDQSFLAPKTPVLLQPASYLRPRSIGPSKQREHSFMAVTPKPEPTELTLPPAPKLSAKDERSSRRLATTRSRPSQSTDASSHGQSASGPSRSVLSTPGRACIFRALTSLATVVMSGRSTRARTSTSSSTDITARRSGRTGGG